mmetsp:Transcript_2135/g.4971  ORF Transcript_2135/g.4971 Transcript_2135/m.4971 type:complete len:871 (-) Transcript_2135:475-3087(-)|eukprot:CAMPEP_0178988742 /NCGR_PEP_ID=MMETSP0795-20121207/3971_1 /TAXON_ID=88552 /ORGANISM="Amoebophrya sp., Strain Ameob2" /LENGTH=870 /DNA_ID=CAMNT_0020680033 /DNA_START=106 /DNA_END=2718 /DNA_ORIENTATION=-
MTLDETEIELPALDDDQARPASTSKDGGAASGDEDAAAPSSAQRGEEQQGIAPSASASGQTTAAADAATGSGPATASAAPEEQHIIKPLTPAQVAMQTDAAKRGFVVKVLILVCFVDTFTMVLFMPAINILTQRAEGGPIEVYAGLLSHATALGPGRAAREAVWDAGDMGELGLSDAFKNLFLTYDSAVYDSAAKLKDLAFAELGMPKAFAAGEVPFKYSTSSNFLAVVIAVTSAIGQAAWGNLSDKYGRMGGLHAAHLGAVLAFIVIYLSGVEWGSYWGFAAGIALKGLSSSTLTVVNGYIRDIMSDEESQSWLEALMGVNFLGGATAALVLMPFVEGRGDKVFDVAWVAFGSVAFSYALLLLYVREPTKKKTDHSDEYQEILGGKGLPGGAEGEETAKTSAADCLPEGTEEKPLGKMSEMQKRILWITIVGCAFDSAGDEGTRIARGTVLQNVWPSTNDIMFQNLLLLSMIVIISLSMGITAVGKARLGLGATAVIGAVATLATQLCLNKAVIHHKKYTTFLVVWYFGKLFGFCSTLAAFFIVNDYSPKDQVGTWSGRLQLAMGVMEAIATMAIANIYDAANEPKSDGTLSEDGKYGVVAMFVTAGVSVCAVFGYAPLIRMVRAPLGADEDREKAFTCKTVQEYLDLPDAKWRKLAYEEIDYFETKRYTEVAAEAEKAKQDVAAAVAAIVPRQQTWGAYPANGAADDDGEIAAFLSNAGRNLSFIKTRLTASLVDQAKMEEERKQLVAFQKQTDARTDHEEQAVQMGKWLAGYFEDAGYTDWISTPHMFKAMMLGAFPPITTLDGQKVDFETVDMEQLYLGYMKASDRLLGNTIAVQKDAGKNLGGATKDGVQWMGLSRMLSFSGKPK